MENDHEDVEEKFPTNEFDIWSDTFGQRIYEFVEATTPLFNDDNYIKQLLDNLVTDKLALSIYKPTVVEKNSTTAAKHLMIGNLFYLKKNDDNEHQDYLNLAFKENYKFCCHCGRQLWSSVPCNTCIEVIFCSENCRNSANEEYHDIECPVLSSLRQFDLIDDQFIYPRIISKAIKEAGGCVDNLMSELDRVDAPAEWLEKIIQIEEEETNYPSDQMDMEIDLSPAEWLEKIIQIEEEEVSFESSE
ncbi:hypothetical protein HCN44_002163 [Aphidius gifuensis]|uniref:MYND-type domain-containing protein n=1 Tax=Aphidius gifuensis TaxID=684658 RepID=A0A834Y212_APHGI|nr:hypothetical protein HCN44_002163 [Aphidius gifuensis]